MLQQVVCFIVGHNDVPTSLTTALCLRCDRPTITIPEIQERVRQQQKEIGRMKDPDGREKIRQLEAGAAYMRARRKEMEN